MSRRKKRVLIAVLCLTGLLILWALGVPLGIYLGTKDDIYTPQTLEGTYEYAVVFGAAVYNGRLSDMLEDRMKTAIALYQSGKVKKLLLSGDYDSADYNEVGAMQRYAMAHGVPEEDIVLDGSGFSTYETVYRAKKLFGVDCAVLVTQRYHLHRALYTARRLGMEAVGADAALRGYTEQGMRNLREILALNKDFLLCLFD